MSSERSEIVLGSIGGEEALTKSNFKYNGRYDQICKTVDSRSGGRSKSFKVGGKTTYGLSLFDANKKVVYNFAYSNSGRGYRLAKFIHWLYYAVRTKEQGRGSALPL